MYVVPPPCRLSIPRKGGGGCWKWHALKALGVSEFEKMRPCGGTSGNKKEAMMGFCMMALSRGCVQI